MSANSLSLSIEELLATLQIEPMAQLWKSLHLQKYKCHDLVDGGDTACISEKKDGKENEMEIFEFAKKWIEWNPISTPFINYTLPNLVYLSISRIFRDF